MMPGNRRDRIGQGGQAEKGGPEKVGQGSAEKAGAEEPGMLNIAARVARKDLLSDLRTLRAPIISVVFSLAVMAAIRYAFADYGDFEIHSMSLLAAASIWIAITLSGMLSISHSFTEENDNGCMNALLMAPNDPSAIYLGKFLSGMWRMGLTALFSMIWFVALFGLPDEFSLLPFFLVCLFGLAGIVAVGTFVASLAAGCSSSRETMFMIMLTPTILSIVVLSVLATASVFEGSGLDGISGYLIPLVLVDIAYFSAAFLGFEYAVGT